jgi:hypothetical protein
LCAHTQKSNQSHRSPSMHKSLYAITLRSLTGFSAG